MKYQLGLIGYPIEHSLSPWIHKNFLKNNNLVGDYSLIEISPEEDFNEAMEELKKSELNGFNVTVPYKEMIIGYLDDIDEQALQIGAVNTVLCQDGKWIGYNTDGAGYVRSLESKYPNITADKTLEILILGAGGAAKGIYHGLVGAGYDKITLANRTIEKAQDIIKHDSENPHRKVVTIAEVEEQLEVYDVIVQTTSVGMKPHVDETIISCNFSNKGAIISDIVYQPILTKTLQCAMEQNVRIHFGHTMLLYQAQLAFEIWTGLNPEMNSMDVELQQILEGR